MDIVNDYGPLLLISLARAWQCLVALKVDIISAENKLGHQRYQAVM